MSGQQSPIILGGGTNGSAVRRLLRRLMQVFRRLLLPKARTFWVTIDLTQWTCKMPARGNSRAQGFQHPHPIHPVGDGQIVPGLCYGVGRFGQLHQWRRFWECNITVYSAKRLDRTRARNASMLRNAFGRANEEIQKFQGFYLEEMRTAASGTSEADIMTGAMLAYQPMSTNHSSISRRGSLFFICLSGQEGPR